jgi:hypothetical protein
MLRRFAARAPASPASARAYHIPISEPIGKGRVIPIKFETLKPVYNPRTWSDCLITSNIWLWSCQLPTAVVSFTVIWACHGGFSGHLPPDPHKLFP